MYQRLLIMCFCFILPALGCDADSTEACQEGIKRCHSKTDSYQCIDGHWQLLKTCETGEVCNEHSGLCENEADVVCTNDEYRCKNYHTRELCVKGQWAFSETCELGYICRKEKNQCDIDGDPL